jgi:hypothetical protein
MHSGLAASMCALDLRGYEASPDHVGQQCAALPGTPREQFERPPLIGGRLGGHQ